RATGAAVSTERPLPSGPAQPAARALDRTARADVGARRSPAAPPFRGPALDPPSGGGAVRRERSPRAGPGGRSRVPDARAALRGVRRLRGRHRVLEDRNCTAVFPWIRRRLPALTPRDVPGGGHVLAVSAVARAERQPLDRQSHR